MMDPRRLFNQDETAIEVSKTIAFCLCFLPFFRNFIGNFTTFRLAQVHKESWQMCRPRSSLVSPAQAENILLHPSCVQQTILSSLHAVFTRVSGMLHSLIWRIFPRTESQVRSFYFKKLTAYMTSKMPLIICYWISRTNINFLYLETFQIWKKLRQNCYFLFEAILWAFIFTCLFNLNNIVLIIPQLSNIKYLGEWNFSVSEKGYITRSLYVEVLRDLDKYLTEKGIPRPVILFIDGANPHISLEAAAFCKEKLIQPWLFKPNMTHIMQVFQTFLLLFFTIYFKPCDLTFFSSLKKQLKKLAWDWQCSPSNCGQSLNKYSIVALLHQAK